MSYDVEALEQFFAAINRNDMQAITGGEAAPKDMRLWAPAQTLPKPCDEPGASMQRSA